MVFSLACLSFQSRTFQFDTFYKSFTFSRAENRSAVESLMGCKIGKIKWILFQKLNLPFTLTLKQHVGYQSCLTSNKDLDFLRIGEIIFTMINFFILPIRSGRGVQKLNYRQKEKQVLDSILGQGYDKRIRPSGINDTG